MAGLNPPHVTAPGATWRLTCGCNPGIGADPIRRPRMKGHVVTTKNDFSEEEWTRIVRAPFVAGLAIALADPGGPIEAAKESMAMIKSATNPSTREQLVVEVGARDPGRGPAGEEPAQGLSPHVAGNRAGG